MNDRRSNVSERRNRSTARTRKSPRLGTLADLTADPDAIKKYVIGRDAVARQRWEKDPIKLRHDDPAQLLRARIYAVGCHLLRRGEAETLIAILDNVRVGRGRSNANVFSAVFSLLNGELPPVGFAASACRKAAAVMMTAHFYDIHPQYVIAFVAEMRGWSAPIDPHSFDEAPAWIKRFSRRSKKR